LGRPSPGEAVLPHQARAVLYSAHSPRKIALPSTGSQVGPKGSDIDALLFDEITAEFNAYNQMNYFAVGPKKSELKLSNIC
jgi:hypothetical protein